MTGTSWLDWNKDGQDWPHRSSSRFVETAGLRWHVQEMGPAEAPVLLLLHGTGASSHSWRHLLPLLSNTYRVVAPDLPCHAFSQPQRRSDLSLTGMTAAIAALMAALGINPTAIIGHSAGAAIAVSLGGAASPVRAPLIVAINGAFRPIRGDRIFSPLAKALFAAPLSASLLSLVARGGWFGDNLLTATGSPIDNAGAILYRRLFTASGHVRGALGMMAAWNLSRFDVALAALPVPPVLIAAKDDPMVPCADTRHAAGVARGAQVSLVDRGGHLLHECRAELIADIIRDAVKSRPQGRVDAA
ncbi:magnesium chelatase [Niveispirillum lacus]|uniref:Magnesium chelatase n=1 Tax=Niveispirillum lacus TaxID=1981099 RepID=A0A255YYH4_9PROT|nr:alpha/beta fold hydrolase BchO [Niveispirillum lacus]OYQ34252.1 magnesium chelatase [Niveispirillum lacus]